MSDQQETWVKLELMGHICLAGKMSEEEKFGSKLGRIDIPAEDGFTTQYFGGQAIYRISVVTEAVARQIARQSSSAPISPWDYPKVGVPAIGHKDEQYRHYHAGPGAGDDRGTVRDDRSNYYDPEDGDDDLS